MYQFRSEDNWPADLETVEVTPILDDCSQHMIAHPEGGYGAVQNLPGLGEPETSLFGSWDCRSQQSPLFPNGMRQEMDPELSPFWLEQTSLNLFSERADVSIGSSHYHSGENLSMQMTELYNPTKQNDEFQSPNILEVFKENSSPSTSFGTSQWRWPSVNYQQTSNYECHQEHFQQSQPSQIDLKTGESTTVLFSKRDLTLSHLPKQVDEVNDGTSLNGPSTLKTPLLPDNNYSLFDFEQKVLSAQHNYHSEYANQQANSDQFWVRSQFSRTSRNPSSIFSDSCSSENLQCLSSSSKSNSLSNTAKQQQSFLFRSLEGPSENLIPVYESLLSSMASISTSDTVYNNSHWSNFSPGTSDSEVLSSGVKRKQKQKYRSRLPKESYNNMSPEEMEARKRELNKICAKEYRERARKELTKSIQEYKAEQLRRQRLQHEEAELEAKIVAIKESFQKLCVA